MAYSPRLLLASALALVLAACADDRAAGDAAPETAAVPPSELTYAPELGVDPDAMTRTASGLYYLDVVEGGGAVARPGQEVVVHYTGWLPDGSQFDSSRGGDPFVFPLGAGRVIPGWDEGVAGMRVGGRRKLVIPPELAYGPTGAGGVIPPNATLVFDVELLEIR